LKRIGRTMLCACFRRFIGPMGLIFVFGCGTPLLRAEKRWGPWALFEIFNIAWFRRRRRQFDGRLAGGHRLVALRVWCWRIGPQADSSFASGFNIAWFRRRRRQFDGRLAGGHRLVAFGRRPSPRCASGAMLSDAAFSLPGFFYYLQALIS
jgi:hypothetical protein